MNNKPLSKHPYHCKLDWGQRGALRAAQRGDVLVIVDTLSFSTAVATARITSPWQGYYRTFGPVVEYLIDIA